MTGFMHGAAAEDASDRAKKWGCSITWLNGSPQ
jgi:hypothetical protein